MIRRSYFTLLEVIIAFFLVTLCAIPLIIPNIWIIKGEKDFSSEIEAGRISSLLITKFFESLYDNKFSWEELNEESFRPVPEAFWEGIERPPGWHYRGLYAFKEKIKKKGQHDGHSFHLFILNLSLIPPNPTEKKLNFSYDFFVERKTKKSSVTPSALTPLTPAELEEEEEEDEEEQEEEQEEQEKE